jgi:hypothetical protein
VFIAELYHFHNPNENGSPWVKIFDQLGVSTFNKPEYTLISCGEGNFYGHPHEELLKRLNNGDSKIKITYKSGAFKIQTDDEIMEIKEYLRK